MVNSNVPRYSKLASELLSNYFFKFKLVLSSVRSNTHNDGSVERTDNKLQTCSVSTQHLTWWNRTASIRFERWLQQCFRKNKTRTILHSQKLEDFFPKLVPLRSLSSSFIDSFRFPMKRCNTSQGFGAFFVQSCDRFLFPFSLFYLFSPFLPFFLDFFLIVAKFLRKQLFYLGLLGIKWL